jgi:hypothetical protein
MTLFGLDCSWWIRTHAFAVDAALLSEVRFAAIDDANSEAVFPRRWTGSVLAPNAPIEGGIASQLEQYLTTQYAQKGELNAESWPFFRGKAMAVLNQSLLTARIIAAG